MERFVFVPLAVEPRFPMIEKMCLRVCESLTQTRRFHEYIFVTTRCDEMLVFFCFTIFCLGREKVVVNGSDSALLVRRTKP